MIIDEAVIIINNNDDNDDDDSPLFFFRIKYSRRHFVACKWYRLYVCICVCMLNIRNNITIQIQFIRRNTALWWWFFFLSLRKKIDWHHIKRQSTRTLYERINKYEREKLPTILTLGNIWYIDQSINQSINQIKSNWKKYQTIKMSVSQSSKQIEGEKKNRIVYWQSLIFFFLSKKKFIYQTIDKWICFCFFLIEYVIDH